VSRYFRFNITGANQMTIVWRIAPDRDIHTRVQELARKETRPVANMLKVLVSEALFARQLAEGKSRLVATIRGDEEKS
jgi:hypothetical protein